LKPFCRRIIRAIVNAGVRVVITSFTVFCRCSSFDCLRLSSS
jgi:hypothetical protein